MSFPKVWHIVPDERVILIYRDSEGKEHQIPPNYFQDNGNPEDSEGDEMVYVRTEVMGV